MKRQLAFLLAILIFVCTVLSACAANADTGAAIPGDLTGDEKVTAMDLTILLQKLEKKEKVSTATDLNLDGVFDAYDAELLQNYLAGVYTAFPQDCKSHKFSTVTRSGKKLMLCDRCGFTQEMRDMTGTKVAYIPIDNRPVNQERVVYLAQSVGIDLLMPEEDLYRTALDNMTKNKNGTTYGDREKLLAWLKETDKTCDYFIISLDQMISGGLVSSRWLKNTDLSFEYEIADEIISLCENNTVILFDTVMRLASTTNYQGYKQAEYDALRSYGRVARKTLTGDQLTIDNIIAGYRFNSYGTKVETSLSESAIEGYHASRERKLRLIDYILKNCGDTMDSIYIGVDDSSPQTTIQTNEINYIKKLMGGKGLLSAGCDELGLCSFTRMVTLLYGEAKANVTYFGPGANHADNWDFEPFSTNINTHLDFMNTVPSTDDDALQILVLTNGSSDSDRNKLFAALQKNFTNHKPTAIIDVSGEKPSLKLGNILFENNKVDVMNLLGYSAWNTAANALGISLSLSISRYLYLNTVKESTEEANEAFLRSMTFAYVKDLSYIASNGRKPDNFFGNGKECCVEHILKSINNSSMITSLTNYKTASHKTVVVSNLRCPWNRNFEATFDITFTDECTEHQFVPAIVNNKHVEVCEKCGYTKEIPDMTGTKVAYIPIDNRPVNKERAEYLAKACGIELLMPEEDLYRTALDNMTKNKNGTTFGDREKLLAWLKEADKECDYFAISLDQMFSGGLVSSRWLKNTDLTLEYEIADEIIKLCKNNTVVLFDTVMRLASTTNYNGYTSVEYEALRSYAKIARKTLTGDQLTVDNIIAGYRYKSAGTKAYTTLSESVIEGYHASRARKLRLIDYVLKNCGDTMNALYVGVDDSSPETTIQTNEINYIKNLMGDRGLLSAGCDELGLCSLTRIATLLYGDAKANVTYFGPSADKAADQYDISTLRSNIDTHLDFLNTVKSSDPDALQVLVLSKDYTDSDLQKMINAVKDDVEADKPVCIIDCSRKYLGFGTALIEKNQIDVAKILGFSAWNTAGNAMGIALANAISRYVYLRAVPESSAEANDGFMEMTTFAYVKDLSYVGSNKPSPSTIMSKNTDCCVKHVVAAINRSPIIVSLQNYKESTHKTVTVSNFTLPWNRAFEAKFDITFN